MSACGTEHVATRPGVPEAGSPTLAPTLTPMRGLRLQRRCACGGDAGLTGECESCAGKQLNLQRRSDGNDADGTIPASVERTLSQPGRPLDGDARSFMESRFGHDFSDVRVHDDGAAAQSARDVHALAYTIGQEIVFAPGRYQPHSESGRQLLAHELAHTVQQRGLQRSGISNLADQGPEYRRLEAEADRAADFALRSGGYQSLSAASRPTLSRAPEEGERVAATGTAPGTAQTLTVENSLMGATTHSVTPIAGFERSGATLQAFDVDTLFMPATKGPHALAVYQAIAGGALQATLDVEGRTRAVQWQERAVTEELRSRWLQAVGWQAGADANRRWQGAGGDATFPQVSNATCQMDHIVELQIGGNNTNENIQALDATQNRNSGGAIRNQVFGLGQQIQENRSLTDGNASQIQLRFRRAQIRGTPEAIPSTTPPASRTCLSVEYCARRSGAGAAAGAGAAPAEDYRVSAGGAPTTLRVPTGFSTTPAAPEVAIDGNASNQSAAELISGLILARLRHVPRGNDRIDATLDTRNRTRLPLTVEGDARPVEFSVARDSGAAPRALTLSSRRPNLAFQYPYLSPGTITQMTPTADGRVNWRGEIRSSVPFLPSPLQVMYENDQLSLAVDIGRRLRSPIPGFTITEARLELSLAPTLAANGRLAFALGRGATAIATGSLDIGADASGFTGTGRIDAHIPGVDEASGTVTMRNGVTTGQIVIESTQIRIPNLQRGRLQLDIDAEGLRPSGEVELLLPRNLGNATLGFAREGTRFVYTGRGTLRVPGLREVEIHGRYDGTTLTARASNVGFRWNGLDGTIDVTYTARGENPGRITGTGRLTIARGGARGTIEVRLGNSGRFSGSGTINYPLTVRGRRIDTTAGIEIDESQSVRVTGALRLPEPIELFRRFGDERRLFSFSRAFPVPSLSIGPIGLQAVIEAGISAGYSFGPGELRNVAIEAAFNPLAEPVNPKITFHCDLHIPASANIQAMIGGGLRLEAGLARVQGTIRISARLALDATAGGPLDVRYEALVFTLTARPGIEAALNLGLSLDANARAEAGVGPFTVDTEKTWNLGRRDVTLGRFSVFAPISYSSESGLTVPSMDQLEWGPMPDINVPDLVEQLITGSSAAERAAP